MADTKSLSLLGRFKDDPADYYNGIGAPKDQDALIFLDTMTLLDLNRPMKNGRPFFELLMAQAEKMNARFVVTDLIAQHELLGKVQNPEDATADIVRTSQYRNQEVLEDFLSHFTKAELTATGNIKKTVERHPRLLLLSTPDGKERLQQIYTDTVGPNSVLHHGQNYGEKDIEEAIKSLRNTDSEVSLRPVFVVSRDHYLRQAVQEGLADAQGFEVGLADTEALIYAMLGESNITQLEDVYKALYSQDFPENYCVPNNAISELRSTRSYDDKEYRRTTSSAVSYMDSDNHLHLMAAMGSHEAENSQLQYVDLQEAFSGTLPLQQKLLAVRLKNERLKALTSHIGAVSEEEETSIEKEQFRRAALQLQNRNASQYNGLMDAVDNALKASPPVKEIVWLDRRATDVFATKRDEDGHYAYSDLFGILNTVPGVLVLPSNIDFRLSDNANLKEKMGEILEKIDGTARLSIVSDDVTGFHRAIESDDSFSRIERHTSYTFLGSVDIHLSHK